MLFQGGHAHTAHRTFGDAVNTEYLHFETGEPPKQKHNGSYVNQDTHSVLDRITTAQKISTNFDIVIAEGTAPIQTLLVYATVRNPDATAIYLAADETFYTLPERKSRHLWKLLKPITQNILDGCIAVGVDVYNWAKPYLGQLPVKIVHPPISSAKYDVLKELTPNSPTKPFRILSVGNAQQSKNQIGLASATESIREKYGSHIQTVFLGNGHEEQSYANQEGIITPGFVSLNEFASWFERASIYVQPSIGDSFPVASLEGMLSGTPTIVTTSVGTRELLPAEQIVEPTVAGFVRGISSLYSEGVEKRIERGRIDRSRVVKFTEYEQKQEFKLAIEELAHNG